MTRRANGEGTISRRGKGWRARLMVDGHRVELYGRTRDIVVQRLRSAIRSREDGVPVVSTTQNVERFMAQWLATKQSSWKPSAYKFNEKYSRLHIVPELGHLQLSKLSAAHLQALYARKLKRLSATSVRHIHAVLHAALASAVRWQIVARNVADIVEPPRPEQRRMTPLDGEQARRLLAAVTGDTLEPLYVLALTTGMRQGELLALRWRDVNLKGKYLEVTGTLQPDGTTSEPKTTSSRRRIALSDAALRSLRKLKPDDGRVFPVSAIRVSRHYRGLAENLGFPSTRFHDLRHSCATLLLGEGTHVKLVSEMLGHSRIQTTLDLYSHVTPSMQEQVARTMDRMLEDSGG